MSETSRGPGFWLASDGEWYPPELLDEGAQRVEPEGAEVPKGPDWWLASDHKWYPPSLEAAETGSHLEVQGANEPEASDWWLASDRQWYGPVFRPFEAQPVQPPEHGGTSALAEAVATATQVEPVTAATVATATEPEAVATATEPEPVTAATVTSPAATEPAEVEKPPVARPTIRILAPPQRINRRRLGIAGLLVGLGVLVIVLAIVFSGGASNTSSGKSVAKPASSSKANPGWTLPGQRILGGPVSEAGALLVFAQTGSGVTELEAIDPSTGRIAWGSPYSVSQIAASIPIPPLVESGVALDLAPVGSSSNSTVRLQGISVSTGKVLWSAPNSQVVSDAPATCTNLGYFCVSEVSSSGVSSLVLLRPTNGGVISVVHGLSRRLDFDVYETDTTPVSIDGLDSNGRAIWMVPVSSVFGTNNFSAADGWSFASGGDIEVGSVGVVPEGATVPLSQYQSVGMRPGDGSVAWRIPGSFQCLGVVHVNSSFLCHYRGDGRFVGGAISTAGVALTLEGVDQRTGSVIWSRVVRDTQSLTTGQGLPLAGGSRVVVTSASGGRVILDLNSGAESRARTGAAYWCSTTQPPFLQPPQIALNTSQHSAVATFEPCSSTGAATQSTPTSTPNGVGVLTEGLFVWSSPDGLKAVPTKH